MPCLGKMYIVSIKLFVYLSLYAMHFMTKDKML